MSQLRRNSNRMALLVGRTFELRVPHAVEACVARLEKQASGEAKLGVRFSKANAGLYEFELLFGGFGVEVVGRGRLEDIGDGHTLIAGHIGYTSGTNVIIAVGAMFGLGLMWRSDSGIGLAIGAGLVVFALYQVVGRLWTFDSWLRWMQEALAE